MNQTTIDEIKSEDISEKEKIIKLLAYHGIHDYIEIEDEATGFLMAALTGDDVVRVKLDGEGGIVVEYDDSMN